MEFPIYLDHAATTPVDTEVLEAMLPFFFQVFANPATLYSMGMQARDAVEQARAIVADTLNAGSEEIVFTSGGTEADNAAIKGAAEAGKSRGRHVLTTPIEHHAVLEPMQTLARQGFEIEFLPVDRQGMASPDDVARRIRPDTILVSVMHANNEIGTIEPVAEIGAICRHGRVPFHVDAVQTYGKIPIDVRAMKIDLLSLSAHKLYGPKGIGALYVRRGTPLVRFMDGGEQENGRRGGTLNVPGIVGLGRAAERAHAEMEAEAKRLTALREWYFDTLEKAIPGLYPQGSRTNRLPNNIHFCLEGVEGEPVLLALDARGICASAGSACTSGSTEPSHVLRAAGVPTELARGAIRMTMGRSTTEEALAGVLEALSTVVRDLRRLMSG